MADKGSIAAIKAEIDEKIIPNNNAQLITGEKLNDTLQDTVDTLDAQHRAAIQQVADDLDTEREVREAEEDTIRESIHEMDETQAAGLNSALQQIAAEKAAREGADESIRETLSDVQSDLLWTTNEVQRVGEALDDETAAREELAQEVSQQGTRLTAAEGVGTTNTADIAVLTGKAAVAATDIQQLKNRATNDEAAIADHEERITENAGAVSGLRDRATILEGEVGDLSTLHTTDKASLVRAINEVLGNPAIARYLFVSWSEKIRPHAANFVALMNNYDMIVVRSRGTVITTYHDTSAIMYEYSEGWRIGSLEGLTLDDDTSFRDMLDYLDEHSSFIASKADIAAVTGDLSDLTTEDKSSLVGAINEVKAGAGKAIPDFARNLVPTGAPSEVEFSSRPTGQGVPGILGSEEVKVVKGNSIVQDGQILNNSVKAIEVTGRNLWDEEWEKGRINPEDGEKIDVETEVSIRSKNFIQVYPNVDYYLVATDTIFGATYDADKNYVGELQWAPNSGKTFPNGVRYIRFYIGWNGDGHRMPSYNHDICINLSDPAFNGQYVPYVAPTTIDLEWVKDIKDGDGNILFPDGLAEGDYATQTKAVKSRFEVDLGSLSWGFSPQKLYSHAARARFDAADPAAEHILALGFRTIIDGSDNYWIQNSVAGGEPCINIGGNPATGVWICINHPDYTRDNAADFVNFLRGKKMYYNTSTPIEVTYPKQETLAAIEDGGIETAIADGNSAPFKGAILYGLDVYKTLVSLVQAQAATTAEE